MRRFQSTIFIMLGYIISSAEVSHSSCAKIIELCLEIRDPIPKPLQRILFHSKGTLDWKARWDSGYDPIITIPAIVCDLDKCSRKEKTQSNCPFLQGGNVPVENWNLAESCV